MPTDHSSASQPSTRPNQARSSREFQEQCLEAADRFSERFLSIMDGLGETLYQMADNADDHELRRTYFAALQDLYSSRQQLKGDFKKQFLASIKAEVQLQSNSQIAALYTNAVISSIGQLPQRTTPAKTIEQPKIKQPASAAENADASNEDQYTRLAQTLPKGSWIEFHFPDKPSLKARFTWVNPASGVYLFVDRNGQKAPDRTPTQLANAFRGGSATLIQSAAQLTRTANHHDGT